LREIQQRVRQYELMAVFSPDLTEEDLPGAINRVSGYITTAGGEVISTNQESPWGRRRLAYAIRYQGRDVRDGYYVLYYFDIQSTQIAEIEREIGLNDKLIRHIITIRGEIPAAPEPEEGAESQTEGGEPTAAPAPAAAGEPAPVPEATDQTEEAAPEAVEAAAEPEAAPAEEAPVAEPAAEAEESESVEPEAEAETTES
jgi:small subunit ribosomal protein S6